MGDIFVFSFLAAQAFVILLWKISPKFFLRFEVMTDIAVTTILMFLFIGTQGGMLIAMISGLIFSLEVRIIRRILSLDPKEYPRCVAAAQAIRQFFTRLWQHY